MNRALRACLIHALALALCLALAAPPAASAWTMELGPPWGDTLYYTVGYDGGRWYAGAYGEPWVARSDPWARDWDPLWQSLPVDDRPLFESVSVVRRQGGRLMVGTEDGEGWQLWAWEGGAFRLRAQAEDLGMYLLAGPEAARAGVWPASAGLMRNQGAGLVDSSGRRITDQAWDSDTPLIGWDAMAAWGGWLMGCSLGHQQYLDERAGRLALWRGESWELLPIPAMAGVLRLAQLPSWPGRVWITTTHGEVWYADAPGGPWHLYHAEDYGWQHGASVWELAGQVVVATAAGKVWSDGQLVARVDGATFMGLAPGRLPDGRLCLAGPVHVDGECMPVRFILD